MKKIYIFTTLCDKLFLGNLVSLPTLVFFFFFLSVDAGKLQMQTITINTAVMTSAEMLYKFIQARINNAVRMGGRTPVQTLAHRQLCSRNHLAANSLYEGILYIITSFE